MKRNREYICFSSIKQITVLFLFTNNSHIYLHNEQVHFEEKAILHHHISTVTQNMGLFGGSSEKSTMKWDIIKQELTLTLFATCFLTIRYYLILHTGPFNF